MIEWVVSLIVALFIISLSVIGLYTLSNAIIYIDNWCNGENTNFIEKVCAIIVGSIISLILIYGLTCFVKNWIYGSNEATNIICNEGNENCES